MSQTTSEAGFLSLGQETSRAIAQRSEARGRLQRTLLVHGPVCAFCRSTFAICWPFSSVNRREASDRAMPVPAAARPERGPTPIW